MSMTTTVSALVPGDQIRWPDGQGGHLWPTVLRNLAINGGEDGHRILLGGVAARMEACPAVQGSALVGVEKVYPGSGDVIIRRPVA